jgi:hypothetical protein
VNSVIVDRIFAAAMAHRGAIVAQPTRRRDAWTTTGLASHGWSRSGRRDQPAAGHWIPIADVRMRTAA